MNRAGIFWIKAKKSVINPQIVVPTPKGSFIPILSATQPQELSPNTIPTIPIESIRPIILGETPTEVR